MEFIGKQREVPPAASKPAKKKGVGSFIPRKDAQEFRPAQPQVQDDYYYARTQKALSMLERPPSKRDMRSRQPYDDYPSKRPSKPDPHHLPPQNYKDMLYSEYDRSKYSEYSSRTMGGRDRYHQSHGEDSHSDPHYPHSGYSESRTYRADYKEDYRGDPGREPTYHRHYDRDQVARVYYDKERLYHQQNSHVPPMERDRRYDIEPEILSRYERRRREELEYARHRDRYHHPSDRINTYDEYERVISESQRRRVQERRRPQDYVREDPRWTEYYRLKHDEMRRRQNAY